MSSTVLIIDDEESIAWALRKACEKQGYTATVSATAEDGLRKARQLQPDVVFLDIRLPGMDGLTALGKLRDLAPSSVVVIMTAHGNLSTAVKAVEGGAFDYLAKPFDLEQALDAVDRAVASRESREQVEEPPAHLAVGEDEIVGRSLPMQAVFKRIALVSPTDACVLITGESGTGKELVARAIHANSTRRDQPFLPIHIAALNPNLVESELFGHSKGAFTGADRPREGLLTQANGGTIFLDELADIPLAVQAKLLRVLERQEVLAVGAIQAQRVNVRIISATHADLASAVASGQFRHDLYFRLNVYPIHLPSLADRTEDIPSLAELFLHRFNPHANPVFPQETLDYLRGRPWPGNIRELRNAVEHAAITARGGRLMPEHFPAPLTLPQESRNLSEQLAVLVRAWVRERIRSFEQEEPNNLHSALMDEIERTLLTEILQQLDGNRQVAGRWLGLARATVRKLIRKYQLESAEEDDMETS